MPNLTIPELLAIHQQLQEEENLIFQFTAYARNAGDPQLRTLFEQIAARHRSHWSTLCGLLGMGSETK